MKKRIIAGKKIFLYIMSLCLFFPVLKAQQSKITLGIGDAAPPITVGKWLKGTPVPQLDKDKIYLVEFWATWCGPCKQNIPHLTEIAKKYAGKISVIGVDIWENSHGNNKSFEECLEFSQKFVDNMGKIMDYTVAFDNKEGDMAKNWVTATGATGIPISFIVQSGKIIWKGHPAEINKVIDAVLTGSYAPSKNDSKVSSQPSLADVINEIMKPAWAAYTAKNYAQTITIADSLIAAYRKSSYGKYEPNVYVIGLSEQVKFGALMETDVPKAVSYMQELAGDPINEGIISGFAIAIVEANGVPKDGYQKAINILLKGPESRIALIYPHIAKAYYKMGDTTNAIAYQEQAVKASEEALKNNQFVGDIRPDVIEIQKATLAKYKSGK